MSYSMVIRGGTVIDGTGAAPFLADVGLQGDRIVEVGEITAHGDEEIDATGKIVTPGFVDVHTHYDGQVTWEGTLAPSSDHGVTTVLMGNCGVGFAPTRACDHQLVIKLMEGVEDIPEVVMAHGVPWTWESFSEYLDTLARQRADIDFAAQIPHSPLRVYVMGERGANMEPPTDADLGEMRRLVTEAVKAGALGVSTSRNLFHRFRSGAFAPSVKTERDELMALAGGLKDAGAGVFQCNPNLDAEPAYEMAVFKDVARASGRPLNFSLIYTPRAPENWDAYVKELHAANREGLKVRAQFMPRPIGVLYGLDLSFHPFSLNPSYRTIADLPLAHKVARLRDPALRARLLAEQPEDPNPAFVGLLTMKTNLYPLPDPADYNFAPEDSLSARAVREGREEREVIYDALLEDDGHAILCSFSAEVAAYLDFTRELIADPDTVISLGDGGAHYGMICDAAYTTYMLADRLGEPGLDLPTMVKALSSQPAISIGLEDRGVVAAGYKADLNVIDVEALTLRRPSVKADLPAGGKRLSQKADGYAATIVSGEVTYRDGQATGARPGRLVRGAQTRTQ